LKREGGLSKGGDGSCKWHAVPTGLAEAAPTTLAAEISPVFFHMSSLKSQSSQVVALVNPCTDKKENQIFLIYKETQIGAVAESND
jgi:hypothetical protein